MSQPIHASVVLLSCLGLACATIQGFSFRLAVLCIFVTRWPRVMATHTRARGELVMDPVDSKQWLLSGSESVQMASSVIWISPFEGVVAAVVLGNLLATLPFSLSQKVAVLCTQSTLFMVSQCQPRSCACMAWPSELVSPCPPVAVTRRLAPLLGVCSSGRPTTELGGSLTNGCRKAFTSTTELAEIVIVGNIMTTPPQTPPGSPSGEHVSTTARQRWVWLGRK